MFEGVELGRAAQLIGRGLFKKVVVADFLANAVVKDVFSNPSAYHAADVLAGIYGYAVQIYADFSGYTDIAIGVAVLLGFRFPENFNRPYASVSISDFWRRWHMTLSSWLRDYLYIPLGGNRKGRIRTYVNLLITMALGGLWHGASGVFIAWGLYQGIGLCSERLIKESRLRRKRDSVDIEQSDVESQADASELRQQDSVPRKTLMSDVESQADASEFTESVAAEQSSVRNFFAAGKRGLRRLIVFHFICVGWVLFNADDLDQAREIFTQLTTGWDTSLSLLNPLVAVVIFGAMVAQYVPLELAKRWAFRMWSLPAFWIAVGFAVWVMIVVVLGPEGVADYIYFQF